MNQLVLVGRIVKEVEKVELESEKKCYVMTIAVQRQFKNPEGVYETDFVPVILWNAIGENTKEYCHKGDVIGVKGRIQTTNNNIEVIADKVTFLSSKKGEDDGENN